MRHYKGDLATMWQLLVQTLTQKLIQYYICSGHNITLLFYINMNPVFKKFMFKKGWRKNSEEGIMLKLDGKNSVHHV